MWCTQKVCAQVMVAQMPTTIPEALTGPEDMAALVEEVKRLQMELDQKERDFAPGKE